MTHGKLERIKYKIDRSDMSVLFNQACLKDIYIYIYIYIITLSCIVDITYDKATNYDMHYQLGKKRVGREKYTKSLDRTLQNKQPCISRNFRVSEQENLYSHTCTYTRANTHIHTCTHIYQFIYKYIRESGKCQKREKIQAVNLKERRQTHNAAVEVD